MTQPKSVFLVTLAVAVCAAFLFAQSRSSYPEFEIRTVTTMTSPTRNPADGAPTISRVFFGRKDGSLGVRTTEVFNNRPCTTTTVWKTGTNEEVTASDCLQMKSTIPFAEFPKHPAIPVASCVDTLAEYRQTGTESIHGLRVQRLESENKTARMVVYVAPDLGCLQVRALRYWKGANGNVVSTTFDEPVEIKLGTHDSAAFEPPASYREVLPSERRNALNHYFTGITETAACRLKGNQLEDKRYTKAREVRKKSVLAMLASR